MGWSIYSEQRWSVYAKYPTIRGKLPVEPKVGENFEMPFLRARFSGLNTFWVEDICHTIEDTTQIIQVSLRIGRFNLYEYYEEHKLQKLDWHEYWRKIEKI